MEILPVVFSLSSPESGETGRTVFLYLKMSTQCQQQISCTFIKTRELNVNRKVSGHVSVC